MNRLTKSCGILDKGRDEFMQAGAENVVRGQTGEPFQDIARLLLRNAQPAVGIADCVKKVNNILIA